VIRAVIRKDSTMRSKLIVIALASVLGACETANSPMEADRGVVPTNIPVVTTAEYVFDAAIAGGALAPGESQRLDGWFKGLGLAYGDSVYLDGDYGGRARSQVADIVGRYGMLMAAGAPVTAGAVSPDTVRVVVSRRRAEVPNCPNWGRSDEPDWKNHSFPGLGCSVNSNLAAMVADPVDLIHGREGATVTSTETVTRSIETYRKVAPTGSGALKSVSTKGN
jgi:pilus assembly protein CpaD